MCELTANLVQGTVGGDEVDSQDNGAIDKPFIVHLGHPAGH